MLIYAKRVLSRSYVSRVSVGRMIPIGMLDCLPKEADTDIATLRKLRLLNYYVIFLITWPFLSDDYSKLSQKFSEFPVRASCFIRKLF